jgi:transcriptional regulator with XRE-family HTH domain
MTDAKRFVLDGREAVREPYHYRACGLEDVYLLNGFDVEETHYGRGVSIHNVEDLHRAIGLRIISDKKPLSAREFRFLRKQMGFTQEQLASRLRVDAQTVARYEKDQTAIPGATDAVLRFLFAMFLIPAERRMEVLTEIAEELESRESNARRAMYFEETSRGWDQGCSSLLRK